MPTTSFWRLGSLSKPCCPACQRRPLDGSLARATPARRCRPHPRSVPRRANCGAPWTTLLGVSRPKKPRVWRVRRMELVPLREFYGHPFRAVDEHQLSRVEIHDLVPGLKPVRSELGDFSLDVLDRKTNVVHPNFVQVAN